MDQVRAVLGWFKRQHFWVLSILIVLIFTGCWWVASGKAFALFTANSSTIKGGFAEIDTVRNVPFHPNEVINKRQAEENTKQLDSVKKIWQTLYDKQSEQVLKWPQELSQAFRDAVDKLPALTGEIPEDLRDNYQNYIERHFPALPNQIGAQPLDINAPAGLGGGMGGPGGPMGVPGGAMGVAGGGAVEDDNYICEWRDQQWIRDELNFPQRPSSLRIWVTQEDLWVYETLLDVIARTNKDATRKSNAAVKIVAELQVGRRAAPFSRSKGRLMVPPVVATEGGGAPEGAPGPAAPAPGGPEGGGPGAPGLSMEGSLNLTPGAVMSPAQEQGFLLSFRYLDDKLQPISVGGGAGGAGAGPADAAAATGPAPPIDPKQFGTGYKRLPVRMVLWMDVRKLPQLIANCANQSLRVEIQEFSINPLGISALTGGGMSGPVMSPGMGGGGNVNLFPDRSGIQTFSARPYDATVVVQGIIYIFNKPSLEEASAAASQPVAASN